MDRPAGSRIGAYEIVAPLGAGGMGEVCRARDTRLRREVAIKILPELFALEVDRRVRFEREAQALAALNHPNIAAIYGFEDAGSTAAIVMQGLAPHAAVTTTALHSRPPLRRYACGMVASK